MQPDLRLEDSQVEICCSGRLCDKRSKNGAGPGDHLMDRNDLFPRCLGGDGAENKLVEYCFTSLQRKSRSVSLPNQYNRRVEAVTRPPE